MSEAYSTLIECGKLARRDSRKGRAMKTFFLGMSRGYFEAARIVGHEQGRCNKFRSSTRVDMGRSARK